MPQIEQKRTLIRKLTHIVVVLAVAAFLVLLIILVRNEYELSRAQPTAQPQASPTEDTSDVVVDESVVTEEQKTEYTVAPDRPRFLSIAKIGVEKARVIEIGLTKENALGTPINIFDTGWLNTSGKPGSGGVLLIDGHNGGPTLDGVFKNLGSLAIGDEVVIERGDGSLFTYGVVENKIMTVEEADQYMESMMVSAEPGKEGLNLITCVGTWSQRQQTYDQRVMLRAVLVTE